MTPHIPTTQEQYRIDTRLRQLETEARLLRSQRNFHSHISKIPPELLSQVFAWLVETKEETDVYDAELPYPFTTKILPIIRVTHVCQRWRIIAIENPSFWTSIPIERPEWAKLCISRCGSLPIGLKAVVSSHCPQHEMERHPLGVAHAEIGPLLARTRLFHLKIPLFHLKTILPYIACLRAPHLNSLHFHFSQSWQGGDNRTLGSILSIEMSQLESLTLRKFRSSWLQHADFRQSAPSLRVLTLADVILDTPATIIHMLSNARGLERLTLTETHFSDTINAYDLRGLPLVSLDKLTYLYVWASLQGASTVLAHIRYPSMCQVDLELTASSSEAPEVVQRFCRSCGFDQLPNLCQTFSIQLFDSCPGIQPMRLDFWYQEEPIWGGPNLSVYLRTNDATALLWKIMPCLSLSNTDKVLIDIDEGVIGTVLLSSLLLCMPRATILTCSTDDIHDVCVALEVDEDNRSCLPDLRELNLVDVSFDGGDMEWLHSILDLRRGCGKGLKALSIKGCQDMTPQDIRLLGSVAEKIEWDGNGVDDEIKGGRLETARFRGEN